LVTNFILICILWVESLVINFQGFAENFFWFLDDVFSRAYRNYSQRNHEEVKKFIKKCNYCTSNVFPILCYRRTAYNILFSTKPADQVYFIIAELLNHISQLIISNAIIWPSFNHFRMHFYFKIAIINYDRHALYSVGEISALFDCQRIANL
jgi:hypothetical protein